MAIRTITAEEFRNLLDKKIGSDVIYADNAMLTISRCDNPEDDRFYMRRLPITRQNQHVKHSLLVSATDLARLNAHWINFCA